jgi:D-alanyl-lipoteichoic acid acyltransferase DltB (MBOAT superfamily)
LIASYVFYGWWDPRFLILIAFSTATDFLIGITLQRTVNVARRRWLLVLSLFVNLGLLFTFKYFNFFASSLVEACASLGWSVSLPTLNIILPVGISFYTFQTLSYTIDVFRGRMPACHDPVAFAAFVAFFPQLVAGPIERASDLLPQFETAQTFSFNEARLGLRQILFGLFKKVVVADQCGKLVSPLFDDPGSHSGSLLCVGAMLFAFQIYGDFSGYSDIAIGSARLLGFKLSMNFRYPYFARDIAEFWRGWHMTLTSWFRDYVYFPLGGNREGRWRAFRNIVIVFLLSALWHGANWTFIVWGLIHTLMYIPLFLTRRHRTRLEIVAQNRRFPSLADLARMAITFAGVTVAWVFFRADSVSKAWDYLAACTHWSSVEDGLGLPHAMALSAVLVMLIFEWYGRREPFALQKIFPHSMILRWFTYLVLILAILQFAVTDVPFIYFQF